jgi:hypothetical protein
MTEENDTNAPIEDIIIMLCDALTPDRNIPIRDPNGPFAWREGNVVFEVHAALQEDGYNQKPAA